MLAMERFFCKVCGSKDMELHRERFCRCKSCESVFTYTIVEKYNKGIVDEVKQALREHELEKLSMLKEQRWALMHVEKNGKWSIAKNVNIEDLSRIGKNITLLEPNDLLSEFYSLFVEKEKRSFSRFIQQRFKEEKAITPEHEDYGFLPDVLEYLAVAAPLEWLDEAKSLAERASLFDYVATLEKRSTDLRNGIYNPSLSRQIFIAYSSKDLELALRLCDELEQRGLSCYISHRNMDNSAKSTADYRYALQTAIANCQLFLFVSTENSRSFDCEAMERQSVNWGEMRYVIETDMAQPKNVGKYYPTIPLCDRKPRLEYCPHGTHNIPYVKTFFSTLEYCRTPEEIEQRYTDLIAFNGWKYLKQEVSPSVAPAKTTVQAPPQDAVLEAMCTRFYSLNRSDKEYQRLKKLLEKDAKQAKTQNNIGYYYEYTLKTPEDVAEAVKWYRKAAEQDDAIAQYNLGVCYYIGKGVEENPTEAVKWYRKAAEQDYAKAQCNLGVCYEYGIGVEKNPTEAVKWFRKAAEQDDAIAQCNLGICYEFGKGVEKNPTEAVKWYRKAAEQDHADAQCNLGVCYKFGKGVEKNPAKAVKWYRKAAEQEHARAQFNLGLCYEHGIGVEENPAEAVKWYRKAAEQGYEYATIALKRLEGN